MIALPQVLVATDFSPSSDGALTYGRALARTLNGSLHLVHVCRFDWLGQRGGEPEILLSAARRALANWTNDMASGGHSERAVIKVSDDPAEAIVAYACAAGMDVIVLGARGTHAHSDRPVGSVAESVLRMAPCTVFCVHGVREAAPYRERSVRSRAA